MKYMCGLWTELCACLAVSWLGINSFYLEPQNENCIKTKVFSTHGKKRRKRTKIDAAPKTNGCEM